MSTTNNKTLIALAASIIALACLPMAQAAQDDDCGKYRPSPEERLERLVDRLDLRDDQIVAFTLAFQEAHEARVEAREAHRKLVEAERDALKAEALASFSEILDEEQMAELEAMIAKREERFARHKSKM